MVLKHMAFAIGLAAVVLGGSNPATADTGVGIGAKETQPADVLMAQYYRPEPREYYGRPEPRGGVGPRRPPRDDEVPTPGSGRTIPAPASAAASGSWTGCRSFTNRFREPFQRCCRIDRRGFRSCDDVYR